MSRNVLEPGPAMRLRHRYHMWRRNSRKHRGNDGVWVTDCECCCIWCEEPVTTTLHDFFTVLATAGTNRLSTKEKQ